VSIIRSSSVGEGDSVIFPDMSTSVSPAAVTDAVQRFVAQPGAIDPAACRRQAERFSVAAFRERFGAWVDVLDADLAGGRARCFG
jgi:hypothetical protein